MSKVLSWSFVLWLLPASAAPGDEVRAEVVKRGSITATVKAVGVLQPEELVDVGAQVAGQVQRLGVDPGDAKKTIDFNSRVEAGTVLAQIDPTLYQAGVDRARAQLHKAQAALKLAEAKAVQTDREAQRARELSKRQAITREDSDHARGRQEIARAEAELARADVELAQAGLKEAEANLAYTAIRAPIKGVIIDRRVNVGQNVVTGLNAPGLFIIARDVKRLQVWAMVKEADVGRIKSGQTAHFTVDAFPNEHFNGVVAAEPRLNATMTQNAVTYTVVINVEATNTKLLPYMTAHIEIVTAEPGNTSRPPRKTGGRQPGVAKVTPKEMTYFARAAAGYNVLRDIIRAIRGVPALVETGELLILPGPDVGVNFAAEPAKTLTLADAGVLARRCPAVVNAAPVIRARTQAAYGEQTWVPTYIYGSTPAFLQTRDWTDLASGKMFTDQDVQAAEKVCVVGQSLVHELFEDQSPLGKTIRLGFGDLSLKVIGVLSRKGPGLSGLDEDDILLAPWPVIRELRSKSQSKNGKGGAGANNASGTNTLAQLYPALQEPMPPGASSGGGLEADLTKVALDGIRVRVKPSERIEDAERQITALLRERHRLRSGQADDFHIREMMKWR